MAQERLLILGAKGLLGTILTEELNRKGDYQILTHSQSSEADFQYNLAQYDEVRELLDRAQADFCINLMALTDVNLCETDPEKAKRLNILPVQNFMKAILADRFKTKLIQISTDHVYDHVDSCEADIRIVNNYARSKYAGDEFAQMINSVVLRTNFFGKSISLKPSFSDWIIQSLSEKKQLRGFTDVFFSPLHVSTLITELERVMKQFIPGVYNLGSRQGMSKYDFMVELGQRKDLNPEFISPIEYEDAKMSVPRPRDMRMNLSKYENTFKVKLPTLTEEILKC
jgi:dTDP-4-dehydrorhamnose reductase